MPLEKIFAVPVKITRERQFRSRFVVDTTPRLSNVKVIWPKPPIPGIDRAVARGDHATHLVSLDATPMSSPDSPLVPSNSSASGVSMEAKICAMQELQRELATLHARLEYVRILLKLGVRPS